MKEIGKEPIIQVISFSKKKRKEKVMTQRRFFDFWEPLVKGPYYYLTLAHQFFLCKREDWCALSICLSFGKDENTTQFWVILGWSCIIALHQVFEWMVWAYGCSGLSSLWMKRLWLWMLKWIILTLGGVCISNCVLSNNLKGILFVELKNITYHA